MHSCVCFYLFKLNLMANARNLTKPFENSISLAPTKIGMCRRDNAEKMKLCGSNHKDLSSCFQIYVYY